MKISFIIPVFNEEKSLNQLYDEILTALPENFKNSYEIIFVDDGSTDSSFEILTNIAQKDKNVKLIKFRKNFGKAAALQIGFDNSQGDYVFTMDSDLQDNPKEIPRFIDKLNQGYDMVTGWKKKRYDPLSKTLPSKLFNFEIKETITIEFKEFEVDTKKFASKAKTTPYTKLKAKIV